MNKKFIFGIIVAILVLMPLASASIFSWLGDLFGITGKVIAEQACIDADNGLNYYVKGTASGLTHTPTGVEKAEATDYCDEYGQLMEYYCGYHNNEYYPNDVYIKIPVYHCPNGCKDGACAGWVITCTDSDGGFDYFIRGSTTGTLSSNEKYANPDHCSLDGKGLYENYCVGNTTAGVTYYQCNCKDGACIKENITCTDSDGGLNYYVKGIIKQSLPDGGTEYNYEICLDDGITITEKYCNDKGEVVYEEYKCPNGCSNGACLAEKPVTTACTDTDGGKDYSTKGYVYGIDAKGNQYKYEDVCHGEYNPPKTGDLIEYSCEGENYTSSYYHCPYNCSNGACLKEALVNVTCTDSDAGKDYYRRGTVYDVDEEGKEYKKEDFCVGNKLMENYCEMGEPVSEYFTCPEGCEDGACIRKECLEITGWRIENGECVTDSGCDYNALKYVYYSNLEECQKHLECVPEWECKVTPPFCPPSGKQTKTCKDVKCGTGKREKEISCSAGQCSGCLYDTTCVPYGQRLKVKDISAYCSLDSVFRPQMPVDAACENDYECLSNECSNGKCISTYSLLQKIFELLKTIFGKGWLWGK